MLYALTLSHKYLCILWAMSIDTTVNTVPTEATAWRGAQAYKRIGFLISFLMASIKR